MAFTPAETLQEVCKIIADKLNMAEDAVKPHATFKDLGADSLDLVEIIMGFEETFGIEIKDEDAEKIKTVQEAAHLIHTARMK